MHYWLILFTFLTALPLAAQNEEAPGKTPVVARVGGYPIYQAEVEKAMQRAFGKREIPEEYLPLAKARILEQLIAKRLVHAFVMRAAEVITEQDVDRALKAFQKQQGGEPKHLQQYLEKHGLTEEQLRTQLGGELGWPLYVRRVLTPEKLQAYFEEHRAEFDGTKVNASHILWKVPQPQADAQLKDAIEKANQVREQILSGELTFGAAAKQFSEGPSRAKQGELGFFPRRGQMVEPFAAAAFALNPGEISQPVVTPFGVHLIRANEIQVGEKSLDDVLPEVANAAAKELFYETAEAEREHTKVEYTDAMPHMGPKGELVK